MTMELEVVLLLYTLTICKGSMLVTQEPPVTLPPSGVLPPANLVDAVILKHHVCLLSEENPNPFTLECGSPMVVNSGVGGWSSNFGNATYCPVTNPECTASQLESVISCDFVNGCGKLFYQVDIDVPGCTEPTNFIDLEYECTSEQPKSACQWEGYSSAENLLATVGNFIPNKCRCVITTSPSTAGVSAYINITLVTADILNRPPDYSYPEANLFVQYNADIQYERVLMSGLRRISMVENLLLESDGQLILGINHRNISVRMYMMFTFRASREIYMMCYDELKDTGPCSSYPCLNGGSCFYKPVGFKCQCVDGFMGQFCEIDMDSCSSNPCLNGGSCANKPMGFQCQCAYGFKGQFCEIVVGNDPLIENVNPLYGPIAGGTLITITGQNFPADASAVLLGTIQCPIIHQSSKEIVSLTPEVGESLVGMNRPVSVTFLGELVVTSDYDYTYRNNPIIESIYPLTTIKHGGTQLTIFGEYMDSVYKPVLEITMVIRETTEIDNSDVITTETQENYTEVCDIGNGNFYKLICYTPAIDNIPGDILNNSKSCTLTQERAEPTHCISGTFYLGMVMDGLNVYKNISEHPDISEYGTIKFSSTPTFNIARRVFEKGKMEVFEGDNVASVGELDYTVWIGSDDCQVMDVKENALTCLPYKHFPTDGSKMKEQAFDIIIGIGTNFNTTIGSMVNKPKLPFVVGGVVLAGVLIPLVITLTVVFTRKKKTKTEQDTADDIIHLPDVSWTDLSDNASDQFGSSVTNNSMGYNNTAQLSDVQNDTSAADDHHEGTGEPYIENERCASVDVPNEMTITPPPLPKQEKCHIYENVP